MGSAIRFIQTNEHIWFWRVWYFLPPTVADPCDILWAPSPPRAEHLHWGTPPRSAAPGRGGRRRAPSQKTCRPKRERGARPNTKQRQKGLGVCQNSLSPKVSVHMADTCLRTAGQPHGKPKSGQEAKSKQREGRNIPNPPNKSTGARIADSLWWGGVITLFPPQKNDCSTVFHPLSPRQGRIALTPPQI